MEKEPAAILNSNFFNKQEEQINNNNKKNMNSSDSNISLSTDQSKPSQ
jgi:hypothetical protein